MLLRLVRSEMQTLLDSLRHEETRLEELCDTSQDDDEITDCVNDLAEVRFLLRRLSALAVETFGPGIAQFEADTD
ncbi:MAG: hypothetical protein ACREMV_14990 [Gemmatimonadales bacterium]